MLDRSRALEADFCAIGARVRQARPLAWDRMLRPWQEVFPGLPLEVKVTCSLRRTGDPGLSPLRRRMGGET